MFGYRQIKGLYRKFVPEGLNANILGGGTAASRAILEIKKRLEANAPHDDLYDQVYFERQLSEMETSAVGIAESIKERLNPSTVLDVGCGSGSVLVELGKRGIKGFGFDYAEAALQMCRDRGLEVQKFDLEVDSGDPPRVDLALSTEVAEHLPESCADRYVDLLCAASDSVLMTAATPGQGGTDHVNEQPNEYWIEKFKARGFVENRARTAEWREDWSKRNVDSHRAKNVMFFTK